MRFTLAICIVFATPLYAQDPEFGSDLFASFCASCHGDEGRGEGELAELLMISPTNLRTLKANNGGVLPVVDIVRQIDGRDPELAHGGIMPLFGEYFDAQDMAIPSEDGQPILTSFPIASLVAYLSEIQE
jgi:mono/diheme cytochrome c family protein